MASVNLSGTRFGYVECGRGEPLMFVHGAVSDYRTWQFQREEFAERFRVIAYSRRYNWPNEQIPKGADYSMTKQVDDLQALLRLLDAAPAHLVGHSYGAFLCLLLAIREPHLVRTLTLAEPPVVTLFVSNTPRPLELLKLLVTRPRAAAAIIKFGAKVLSPASQAFRDGNMEAGMHIFVDTVFGSGGYRALSESRKEQVRANLANLKAALLGSGFAPLNADQVRSIRTPTLLVNGEHSIGLFHHLTDRLEELMPHAERVTIRGVSHMMQEENGPAFNAAVLSFLAKHHKAV